MRRTPRSSWRRTSRERVVADARGCAIARRHLCTDGGRHRPGLRRAPPRQLRLRAAHHGGCIRDRVRVRVGVAVVGGHPALLRGGARADDASRPDRVSSAPDPVACGDARGHVRGRLPDAEHRSARVRAARHDRVLGGTAQSALGHRRRRDSEDRDRLHRRRGRLSRASSTVAATNVGRTAHARGGDGLPYRPHSRRSREPRHWRSGAHLRPSCRRLRGHVDRPQSAGDADLRARRHDYRARRRRPRRSYAAHRGDARRLHDRLRERDPRRSAPDQPEPVPAHLPVCRGDPRPPHPPERALRARRWRRTAMRKLLDLAAPAALVLATALLGLAVSSALQTYFLDTLVKVAIVVALYVFIGNSGVLSFGHISFVALGVWTAGVLTVPAAERAAIMPGLAGFLRTAAVGNVPSLLLAAVAGLVFAFAVGLPLMRLSGLAAGIATFGVLEIVNNVLRYYDKIGPGLNAFSSVPETTGIWQAAIGALVCVAVAYAYQRSPFGRQLRATREDPAAASAAGISIYRQRLLAFAVSGALAGLAGGLYVHLLPVEIDSLYLDVTFLTLAMLVVGGSGSLLGAVVGALAIGGLDSFLSAAENGVDLFGWHLNLPTGTAVLAVGALMALVLIVRPSGLTGGREFSLAWMRR